MSDFDLYSEEKEIQGLADEAEYQTFNYCTNPRINTTECFAKCLADISQCLTTTVNGLTLDKISGLSNRAYQKFLTKYVDNILYDLKDYEKNAEIECSSYVNEGEYGNVEECMDIALGGTGTGNTNDINSVKAEAKALAYKAFDKIANKWMEEGIRPCTYYATCLNDLENCINDNGLSNQINTLSKLKRTFVLQELAEMLRNKLAENLY